MFTVHRSAATAAVACLVTMLSTPAQAQAGKPELAAESARKEKAVKDKAKAESKDEEKKKAEAKKEGASSVRDPCKIDPTLPQCVITGKGKP